MSDFDIFNKENNKEQDVFEKTKKTAKDDWNDFWDSISKSYDWRKLPLYILIGAVLSVGAYLMFTSIYSFTGLFVVAILAPAFSEIGLISFEVLSERNKNSEKQKRIALWSRNWHILASTLLLCSNLAIESAQNALKVNIDGASWLVFGIIAMTSFIDVVQFFRFLDNDDENNAKRLHSKNVEKIKLRATQKKLEVYEQSESVKSEALVSFWKLKAPALADLQGRLEAAKEIKDIYSKVGMTPEEAENYLNSVGLKKGIDKIQKELEEQPKFIQPLQPPTKRKYTKKITPQTHEIEQEKINKLQTKLQEKEIIPVGKEVEIKEPPFENQKEDDW